MMTTKQNLVIFLIMVLLCSAQSTNIWRNNGKTYKPLNRKVRNDSLHPNVEHCKDQGICSHVPNYPDDLAKSVLNQLNSRNITKFALESSYIDGEHVDYENICSDKEKVVYPKAAKNINGTWKFILNGNSFQGFVVEICKKRCQQGIYSTDYELKCIQKYVYKKMAYLDVENRIHNYDSFGVPSCCSCSLLLE